MGEKTAEEQIKNGISVAERHRIHDARTTILFVIGWTIAQAAAGPFNESSWIRSCKQSQKRAADRNPLLTGRLVIRNTQMKAFAIETNRRLQNRISTHLNSMISNEAEERNEADLRAIVAQAPNKAEQYGISDEKSITMLAELMLTEGLDFEKRDHLIWSDSILRSSSIPSRSKLDMVFKILKQHSTGDDR